MNSTQFWSHVEWQEDCLVWTGAIARNQPEAADV